MFLKTLGKIKHDLIKTVATISIKVFQQLANGRASGEIGPSKDDLLLSASDAK